MARLKTFRERLAKGELPPAIEVSDPAEAYDSGLEGAIYDPEGEEELLAGLQSEGKPVPITDAAGEFGWESGAADGLYLPFQEIYRQAPGMQDIFGAAFPQQTGDCVSHSLRHCLTISLAAAASNGNAGWPKLPPETVRVGGFHPSPNWWYRGHSGSGDSCPRSLKNAKDHVGMVVATNYPAPLNLDLSRYSSSIATKWGRSPPPSDVEQQLGGHKVKAYASVSSWDEVVAALKNGYGIHTCGGESWSKTRDARGVSQRTRGGWSHSLCYAGVDVANKLVLIMNSWGRWNSGPREIRGDAKNGLIPHGSFWSSWDDCKHRSAYAVSAIDSWPAQKLKPWNLRGTI
ncbi:MAG: hypothetical protein ACO3NZ_14515 [Pirellulales bacterium]